MENIFLDEVDYKILDTLIEDARTPFTDIAKKLIISPGTVHIRVKKMEARGIIQGATLTLNYKKLGYDSIAHLGILLEKTALSYVVIDDLEKIPNVTVAYMSSGKYDIFCKIRAKNIDEIRQSIFDINQIKGVIRTESMIALKECINDKKRIMRSIFKDRCKKTK